MSTTKYDFINEKFMKIICQKLEIKLQYLIKLKPILGFDGKAAQPIIYAIYFILFIENYTKSPAYLLITKLSHYPMIFDHP